MPDAGRMTDAVAAGASRRGFLARVGGALVAAMTGSALLAAARPDEAEAFHFCGHTHTTGSCPHPLGRALPRVDARGYPVRPRDGKPVDDRGRLVDAQRRLVDERGVPLRDTEGDPLPPVERTSVCEAVSERFGFETAVDGSWYRCCNGRVRKLMDCCARRSTRINGDRALPGYCYSGRKVFCVMYYDTKVPC